MIKFIRMQKGGGGGRGGGKISTFPRLSKGQYFNYLFPEILLLFLLLETIAWSIVTVKQN